MFFVIRDAEAAVYAIDAAVCLIHSVAAGDVFSAILDTVSLVGWVKNAL